MYVQRVKVLHLEELQTVASSSTSVTSERWRRGPPPRDLLRRNHLDDNLYDAVAGLHGEVCLRVVEEHDSHRAAVVLVDHPAPSRESENLLVSSCLRRVRGRVRPLPKTIIRYNNYVQAWKIENKLKEKCIQDTEQTLKTEGSDQHIIER